MICLFLYKNRSIMTFHKTILKVVSVLTPTYAKVSIKDKKCLYSSL